MNGIALNALQTRETVRSISSDSRSTFCPVTVVLMLVDRPSSFSRRSVGQAFSNAPGRPLNRRRRCRRRSPAPGRRQLLQALDDPRRLEEPVGGDIHPHAGVRDAGQQLQDVPAQEGLPPTTNGLL
jgi:hypothetical protein